ncbi:hypothetical protein BJY52DRAFT_1227584 [Lactarius psammicola]|nr:hypothetical protein BJY52DRAFT_1227584 [Lactarius psammicola]
MGLCEAFVWQLSCLLWAIAISSAVTQASLLRAQMPMQADRQNSCFQIKGPCEAFIQQLFYLLWAITTASAVTKANPMGPYVYIVNDINGPMLCRVLRPRSASWAHLLKNYKGLDADQIHSLSDAALVHKDKQKVLELLESFAEERAVRSRDLDFLCDAAAECEKIAYGCPTTQLDSLVSIISQQILLIQKVGCNTQVQCEVKDEEEKELNATWAYLGREGPRRVKWSSLCEKITPCGQSQINCYANAGHRPQQR